MSQQARSFVASERISAGSSSKEAINPYDEGVEDREFDLDISIQNTGSTVVWVQDSDTSSGQTAGTASDGGHALPNQYDSISFNNHTTDPGDVNIYFPDSAGGQVDIIYTV